MEAVKQELARLQALKLAAEQKRNELRARLGLPPMAVVQAGGQGAPLSIATATAAGAVTAAAGGAPPGSVSDEGSAGAAAAIEEGKGAAGAAAAAAAAGEDDSALSAVERHQIQCAQKLGIVHVLESLLLRPAAQEVSVDGWVGGWVGGWMGELQGSCTGRM